MKTVFVNIRMTPEFRAVLQALADAECRSLTGQITFMLSNQLQIQNTIKAISK